MGYIAGAFTYPIPIALSYDPAGDDNIPLLVCPQDMTIVAAKATVANDVAASTADYFSLTLVDGGADGSGTSEISDTIGGTAGWTGLNPKSFTMTEDNDEHRLDEGDVVILKYDETGTGTFTSMVVQLDVRLGDA